jgi:hypothetical protein
VHVTVDGIAASIASVIAMAGDTVTMNRGTQLMVHNPSGLVLGTAEDMRQLADTLDRIAVDIAGLYRDRAGGSHDYWLDKMKSETWYAAQEAVDAGLADAVIAPAVRPSAIAAVWRGNPVDEQLVGRWTAWSVDYADRTDRQARSGDADPEPGPREVKVTRLRDGREQRTVGRGLVVITDPRNRRTLSRSDAAKARHAGRYRVGDHATPTPLSPEARRRRSDALKAKYASRRQPPTGTPPQTLKQRSHAARARQRARQQAQAAAERWMLTHGGAYTLR